MSILSIVIPMLFTPQALPQPSDPSPPMILERLGEHRRMVATESEAARKWFDQGMALMYGYNFDGAIASFLEATRLDPDFAMAWWGIGYAAGPNQNNDAIVPPKDEWSYTAARKAYELRERDRKRAKKAIKDAREWLKDPTPLWARCTNWRFDICVGITPRRRRGASSRDLARNALNIKSKTTHGLV